MSDDEDLLGPRRRLGRPPKPSSLRDLLILACPPDIAAVARALVTKGKEEGQTIESVYRWIRVNRIPPLQAARLVDASEGRTTLADFYPYIFFENLDA